MKKVFRFLHFIDAINERVGNVICWLLVPLASIMMFEIVMRYVFNKPTIWSFELGSLLFGGLVVLSGGYVLLHRGHIIIDVVYSRLSRRKQAIMDLWTAFFFFLFCGILLWRSAGFSWDSILSQEKSSSTWGPVLWPIKTAVFIGAILIFLQGIAEFIRNLYIAITGKEEKRQ